ncbi:hypothetical protein ES288_D11G150700v1 [Gossypium darwinii]|uniref:Uncharacterized protein n=1 Tax=Gossypium darwinii TaxID=34276 RepID=A0A5D2AKU2_GOSDA|nr:hypothetical protein GOBAR_DD03157 [Gossypium barbadense]TYG45129.1 hypothetical protein ES288_D11G150700v1 [Gossypium darwinii]
MSCLKIRLPLAKKVWKSFTSKLQTRLHKLHKSKTIKKLDNTHLQTTILKTTRPSLFLGQHLRNKRRCVLLFGFQHYYVSKNKATAAMPIYIDKLSKEAPLIILVEYIPQQPPEKKKKLVDEVVAEVRTSKELEKQRDDLCDSRSLVLASLMINEIDAKDEQFIASFQAEIERQEIIARHL